MRNGVKRSLLSSGETAVRIGVHKKTLTNWCLAGTCPIPFTTLPSGHRRFAKADIDQYLAQRTGAK